MSLPLTGRYRQLTPCLGGQCPSEAGDLIRNRVERAVGAVMALAFGITAPANGNQWFINAGLCRRECGQRDGTLVPEERKLAIRWSLIASFPLAGMEGVKPSDFKLLSLHGKQR